MAGFFTFLRWSGCILLATKVFKSIDQQGRVRAPTPIPQKRGPANFNLGINEKRKPAEAKTDRTTLNQT
jgi:hypothetical protein